MTVVESILRKLLREAPAAIEESRSRSGNNRPQRIKRAVRNKLLQIFQLGTPTFWQAASSKIDQDHARRHIKDSDGTLRALWMPLPTIGIKRVLTCTRNDGIHNQVGLNAFLQE